MPEVTDDMKFAMDWLALNGQTFYRTREVELPCGCWVIGGFDTRTYEPNIGVITCSFPHKIAAAKARERWTSDESMKRFENTEAHEAMRILLEEEIQNA